MTLFVDITRTYYRAVKILPCGLGAFTNDVSREGEGEGYPNSDAVREVA